MLIDSTRTAVYLGVALIALLAAGCVERAGDAATQQPGASPAAVARTATAAPEGASGTSSPGDRGEAISRSDVAGIPDSPITSGDVLFFPEVQAGRLGETGMFDPAEPGESRHASFELDEARLDDLDGEAAGIGENGRFAVEVPDGDYLVCLANTFSGHSPGPPFSIAGCDPASIASGERLQVTHGEGGVQASSD